MSELNKQDQKDEAGVQASVQHLHIFVNQKKFEQGITPIMSVDTIAGLVGLTAANATVRRQTGEKAGPPLTGDVEIHQADHFVVTRNAVQGGYGDVNERISMELSRLAESGQRVTRVASPNAVIFHDLPTANGAQISKTDVLVPIPAGYPAALLDLAFLPDGSPMIGRVKGQAQGVITANGTQWRQISYHPHNGGGGAAWNPNVHGLHTYVDEILAWLGSLQ